MTKSSDDLIYINNRVSIPAEELRFKFSRASGPGGQFTQKVSTRVQLAFDVLNSPSLSEEEKGRAMGALKTRINKKGVLQLVTAATRSQALNRKALIERFQRLMGDALRPRKKRVPTRPSAIARELRLREKKRRSEIKRNRAKIRLGEEL